MLSISLAWLVTKGVSTYKNLCAFIFIRPRLELLSYDVRCKEDEGEEGQAQDSSGRRDQMKETIDAERHIQRHFFYNVFIQGEGQQYQSCKVKGRQVTFLWHTSLLRDLMLTKGNTPLHLQFPQISRGVVILALMKIINALLLGLNSSPPHSSSSTIVYNWKV